MADGFAKTPRYVLKGEAYPTFPSVLQISPDVHRHVIYGFSDKPGYDVFLSGSSIALTPYPLVKGFLTKQVELDSGSLRLVVLDAASSAEQCLYAATFQSVLESFHLGSECVTVSHRLVLEESSSLYRLRHFRPYEATIMNWNQVKQQWPAVQEGVVCRIHWSTSFQQGDCESQLT